MEKTPEELTIENENLKQGNIKVWEQLEKSTEILSHHEAYISLLEEENTKLKELLKRVVNATDFYHEIKLASVIDYGVWYNIANEINQVLGEE